MTAAPDGIRLGLSGVLQGWPRLQELLQMVPQPVLAVLLLFPVTEDSEKVKDQGMASCHDQWLAAMLCSLRHMLAHSELCMPAFCQ